MRYKLIHFCEIDGEAVKSYCTIHNENNGKNLGNIEDVDEKNLDPEIIKNWEETKRPLKDIYNEVTLKKLMAERAARKANEENFMASSGSVSGIPDKEEVYTDDIVRKMSDKEFSRNFEKILKQYKKGEK